jgi:hypothetical protein
MNLSIRLLDLTDFSQAKNIQLIIRRHLGSICAVEL